MRLVHPNRSTSGSLRLRAERLVRRVGYLSDYLTRFVWFSLVNREGLWSAKGRRLIFGKIRRSAICAIPGVGERLKQKYTFGGGCVSCGASCNLLIRCPHWDATTGLCTIYDDRPLTCRLFPITPADLEERDLVSGDSSCGYYFPRPARDEQSETALVFITDRTQSIGSEVELSPAFPRARRLRP